MINRFNRLTSKEWLPFQKSWFKYQSDHQLYKDNLRFFCKADECDDAVFYFGNQRQLLDQVGIEQKITITESSKNSLQFALLDLRDKVASCNQLSDYLALREQIIQILTEVYQSLLHRRFICVFIPNRTMNEKYWPFAWDMAMQLASIFSLKDEKIACWPSSNLHDNTSGHEIFYCLYFRKDEHSNGLYEEAKHHFFDDNNRVGPMNFNIPSWFILKPAPRKKNEILHPAKYPESLVTMFLSVFTNEGDNVFDPMSGTGSTQVAALKSDRNAFGTELSEFFANIAHDRCKEITEPSIPTFFDVKHNRQFRIINKDAREIGEGDFPTLDYVITSPPYWDMLNMKGAENQAKRLEKGLQTNYSEDKQDLGNIADYQQFLDDLAAVYFNILKLMKPGAMMTIVVKNIKKKGTNYPFAWDLTSVLMQKMQLLPEVFWCQDDINLAPYGYGNTFVSNTFHQYCLTFRKPVSQDLKV